MCDRDNDSFSLVSTADAATIFTPTEDDTDEFEVIDDSEHEDLYAEVDSTDSTSVSSSVYVHEYEHGRRYHSYRSGRYPLPNDFIEQQREGIRHALMLELTDGKLFFSDIGDYPQKIIDIGTGTVADSYPSASVIGTDLSPIQPSWLPINAQMFIEDCEDPEWMHGSNFDLVHFRDVAGVLRDLDAVVDNAYRNVKPGGWIEFQEFDPRILCDDGFMKDDDPLRLFSELCTEGMRKFGRSAYGKCDIRRSLEQAGFVNVHVQVRKVPVSPWSRDRKMRMLGMFMKTMILESLGAYAAKPLVALGLSPTERNALVTCVRESLENSQVHRYVNCCFYCGQKEELVSDSESYFE